MDIGKITGHDFYPMVYRTNQPTHNDINQNSVAKKHHMVSSFLALLFYFSLALNEAVWYEIYGPK